MNNHITPQVGSRVALILPSAVLDALGRSQLDATHEVVADRDGYLVIKPTWRTRAIAGRVYTSRESLITPDRVVVVG